ncbi:MAG: DEAD/DEAH box helicase family protein [Muribaculaceae bacterium]|nr:DEAD/DEAH box helicase family protein [Muribaculaceae bacterium]
MSLTLAQQKYFAHWLTRSLPSNSISKLTASLQDAQVDLTPHQIDAALFAFKSPLSKGAILADEVGLGKTIEAGIILSQFWAEHRRHLLIIAPANLRKQWASELQEKFFLPSRILEAKTFNHFIEEGNLNPFNCEEIVICSYQFAKRKAPYLKQTKWDLVVIDEAHRLRNVYKSSNVISNTIKNALVDSKKILLTATPLQNSILELYGLTTIIDDYAFGDLKSFKMQYGKNLDNSDYENLRRRLAPLCKRTLRRQVLEYVRYTKRIAILQEFFPTKQEQELYDLVSEYLQRPKLYALPNSQRQLMTLILRKLLASSTHAIYGTLSALVEKLQDKLKKQGALTPEIEEIKFDYEDYESETEEWFDNEEEEEESDELESLSPEDIERIKKEIVDLEKFRDLAFKIKKNSKAEQLFEGLDQGFAQLEELGAPQKALIFTESRRTQDFLLELLEKRGYKGKVVLFNGSNSDKKSKEIYNNWKEKNKGTSKITGSMTADKRAALVDYFRDEATIMIATEAAAEGINLQFCSLIVNYDMPWNPQRIEQRIGRCHRYGQNFDVVVINFLNKSNAADVRVYELLDQKFQLFNGVFGASDEVLGAIGNGVDFEKRIALIYQQCRSPKEIQEAFDALQEELQEQISDKMIKARSTLLENFDESVKQKLRDDLKTTQDNLNLFEENLWRLTRSYFDGQADFNDRDHSFVVCPFVENGTVSWYRHFPGVYKMVGTENRRTALDGGVKPYRIGDPLAQYMLTGLKETVVPISEITLDYTNSPLNVALIKNLVGQSGWLTVEQLTIDSFEKEDILLHAAVTDNGKPIPADIAEFMMRLKGSESPLETELSEQTAFALTDAITAQRAEITAANAERNNSFFEEEMEKLENWAEDVKAGLEKELRDLDAEIKLRKSESKKTSRLDEKVKIQRMIKDLEKKRSEKRLNLYHAQDEVDSKKDTLLSKVEAMLEQKITQSKLVTFHWRIV